MREASRALERAGIKKVRPVPARSGASPEEAAVLSLPEPGQGVKVEERRHYFQQIEDIQEILGLSWGMRTASVLRTAPGC